MHTSTPCLTKNQRVASFARGPHTGMFTKQYELLIIPFCLSKYFPIITKKIQIFCDRDVSKCISVHLDDASQFKCAIMYEDLPRANNPSKTRPLTWLGALPDALRKESIQNSEDPELKASFGNIEAKSFWWRLSQYSSATEFEKERCNAVHASAKCYASMIDPALKKLDSCAANIINEEGKQTFGDSLCQNLYDNKFITPEMGKIEDIKVGMHYSYCGGRWEPVQSEGEQLTLSEKLCCKPDQEDDTKYRFYRCDGSNYKTSDTCK